MALECAYTVMKQLNTPPPLCSPLAPHLPSLLFVLVLLHPIHDQFVMRRSVNCAFLTYFGDFFFYIFVLNRKRTNTKYFRDFLLPLLLLNVFSYFIRENRRICTYIPVCRKWMMIVNDGDYQRRTCFSFIAL